MTTIIQKGSARTNSSPRQGYVPLAIVNHISVGSAGSVDSWFTSPDNEVSSAHFLVTRSGELHQYVDIRRMAWGNGLDIANNLRAATAPIIYDMKVNPNLFTVSIEHEGYEGHGLDGSLTDEQFTASVRLHKYIQAEVKRIWGAELPLDEYHVFGHCHVNKISKPHCPGPNFPWERLYAALKGEDQMKFPDVEADRWSAKAIEVVAGAGIMTGFEDGTFRPAEPLTREQAATIINHLLYLINNRT